MSPLYFFVLTLSLHGFLRVTTPSASPAPLHTSLPVVHDVADAVPHLDLAHPSAIASLSHLSFPLTLPGRIACCLLFVRISWRILFPSFSGAIRATLV